MPDLELRQLTKRYGNVIAVDGLTARMSSGRITAFLGANGSGKTTTMRMLLGLSEPDAGTALIGGRRYRDLPHPLRVVGAVLDQGFHPNRSARNHLRIVAAQAGVPAQRVDETLAEVGLLDAATRRVGGYSLGMRQRLNLAAAMVGGPDTLVLDEPFNGLDPAGIQSMRAFLRDFASTAARCFSRATCSRRSPTAPTTRSWSTTVVSWVPARSRAWRPPRRRCSSPHRTWLPSAMP